MKWNVEIPSTIKYQQVQPTKSLSEDCRSNHVHRDQAGLENIIVCSNRGLIEDLYDLPIERIQSEVIQPTLAHEYEWTPMLERGGEVMTGLIHDIDLRHG